MLLFFFVGVCVFFSLRPIESRALVIDRIMAERVRENQHFFHLLLSTHPHQKKALLQTITNEQIDFLSEVFHNLLYVLPLTEKERKPLSRKKYLAQIGNIKRSYPYRKARIKKHSKQLIQILENYTRQFKALLNSVQ